MKEEKINKQGTTWFAFYVYVRPLLSLLLNIHLVLTYIKNFSELPFYGQIYLIGTILLLALNMIIWSLALGRSKKLVTMINFLLIYETLFLPMGYAISENFSNTESILIYFIGIAIYALIWFWPNYVYFKKRKWIFQNDEDIIICKNCNNKILKNETKCPCCKKVQKRNLEEKKEAHNQKESSNIDQKYSDLNKLKELLDNDVITKEEFDKEKKKVLNDK